MTTPRLFQQPENTLGERITIPDADITLLHEVWPGVVADRFLAQLLADIDWQQHELRLFGRRVKAPRLSAWYGDHDAHYAYSGLRLVPQPWIAPLAEIKRTVETLCDCRFNGVLLNHYRHGADSMGWHSDDEPELGPEPVIASVSLGAPRVFRLKHKRERGRTYNLELPGASVLVMRGATQRCWQHSLPKTRRDCGSRVNLTYRWVG